MGGRNGLEVSRQSSGPAVRQSVIFKNECAELAVLVPSQVVKVWGTWAGDSDIRVQAVRRFTVSTAIGGAIRESWFSRRWNHGIGVQAIIGRCQAIGGFLQGSSLVPTAYGTVSSETVHSPTILHRRRGALGSHRSSKYYNCSVTMTG